MLMKLYNNAERYGFFASEAEEKSWKEKQYQDFYVETNTSHHYAGILL